MARQSLRQIDVTDRGQLLLEAVKNLLVQGYRELAIEHVVLEMRRLVRDGGNVTSPDYS